jgi:hypothetical protein
LVSRPYPRRLGRGRSATIEINAVEQPAGSAKLVGDVDAAADNRIPEVDHNRALAVGRVALLLNVPLARF